MKPTDIGEDTSNHPKKYVSERVVNISECESKLAGIASLAYDIKRIAFGDELFPPDKYPPLETIKKLSEVMVGNIDAIKNFEFVIERRTTIDYSRLDEDQPLP